MKQISIFLCVLKCFVSTDYCHAQVRAAFSANIVTGCSPIIVNFSDESEGNPSEWKWDLGNGTLSTLKNPSVTYLEPGVYTVKLWIRSGNRIDSLSKINYILVLNSPVVNFRADSTIGCTPFSVAFTDLSSFTAGNILSRQWDFGDGILSTEQHPLHTYIMPGNFNVTLKVMGTNGCSATLRKSSYILNNSVKASFINWVPDACSPQKYMFQNESSGSGALHFTWQFGDGTYSSMVSPVHTYSIAGVYTVKLMVQSESGCLDSMSKKITVYPVLAASFTADNVVNCKAPAVVQFTNTTVGTASCKWSFGDNTYSTLINPSHQFNDTGAYSVKLSVTNTYGCSDSILMQHYIKVQKAEINIPGVPDSGCIPFTRSFTAYVNSYDSIINYKWDFGNNILLTGASPVYTFTNTGNHNLLLITTTSLGCRDTMVVSNAIKTGNRPVANFSVNILSACASTVISFIDESIGEITSWQWDFGDQSLSFEKNPVHVYLDTGWMTVRLTVRDAGCSDVAVYTRLIYIQPSVSKFKVLMQCENPYKRTFNNFSIGAMRWEWSFGDGTTSNEFSPVHTFPSHGLYYVVLKTWNDSTGCSYIAKKAVKIIDVPVSFFADDTMVCKMDSVFFTAVTDPDIINYTFYFGDGSYSTSNKATAAHVYKQPGVYSVSLFVKDSLECVSSFTRNNYIRVNGPLAKFASSNYNVCVTSPVMLIDSSISSIQNPVKEWYWDYGDGLTDTFHSPPFFHSYENTGVYSPFVKITDSMGCTDTFTFVRPIKTQKIFSLFYISDSVACPENALKFVCPYSVPGITYRWDFGDGNTSAQQIVYHSYTREGTYSVRLYVTLLNSCTDSTIKLNAVVVKQTIADFSISDSFSACPPLLVTFTGSSSNALYEYWSFGDSTYADAVNPSHYYTYPGDYNAILFAKGHGACVDTIQKRISIKGPKGKIVTDRISSCKPFQYSFTAYTENTASCVWDFDDGATQVGNDSFASHLYSDPGRFVPKIILEDATGCRVPVLSKDTLTNIFVKADFVLSDSVVCERETVPFINFSESNDSVVNFLWNFGDSIFSNQRNVNHQYNSPGIFYPSLQVVTSAGCVSSLNSLSALKVLSAPSVSILTSANGCAPLKVMLHAATSDADSSELKWKWTLGNGDTSVLQHPPVQTYTKQGDYLITLSATNSNGCSNASQNVVTVYPLPLTTIAGGRTVCKGRNVSLYANGAEKYLWMSSENLSCDTCAVTITSPANDAAYILRGTSAYGCVNADTFHLSVYQPVHLHYKALTNMCKGSGEVLTVTGADSYKWSPSYGLSAINSASPVANPDSSIEYTVIGSDVHGCFNDTGHLTVKVHNYPLVKACDDKTVSLGTPVSLDAIYSSDVTEVYWSPTDNLFRYDANTVTVKPKENTEYTVQVKNGAGCDASDKVTVFVVCNQNNVFVPNLFSPNNDGVNDVFYPRGTGLLKVQTLRIFNRWGETVFEKKSFNANDPSSGWDGTFKGTKLISDVFVYVMDVICENNSILSLRGNISLAK